MNAGRFEAGFPWRRPAIQQISRNMVPATGTTRQRTPFSRSKDGASPALEQARKTARIYLFTGSNTPYQSHE